MNIKETLTSIKEKFKKRYEKNLEKVYEEWQKPLYFKEPKWFMILELIAFRSTSFIELREKDKVKKLESLGDNSLTRFQRFLKYRILESDYTFPLPKFIYNKVYNTNRRLSNTFLINFYNNILGVLKSKGNETKALYKFFDSPYINMITKKVIKQWLDRLYSGEAQFKECMLEKSTMFGEFETNIYFETSGSGINIDVLNRIIDNLKDLVQLDKAKKSIRRTLYTYGGIILITAYALFGFIIPKLFDNMEAENLPSDLDSLYHTGLFLQTPLGVCTVIFILLCIKCILGKIKSNQLICGLITRIPGIGSFIRFVEMFLFTDCVLLFYKHMKGTEDKKIERASNVISNSFLRGFVQYRLNTIRNEGARVETFFKDNQFYGEYSEFLTVQGDMVEKLEKLVAILKYDKDEVIQQLPDSLKSLVSVVLIAVVMLFLAIVFRVEIWVAQPDNLQI